MKKANSSTVLAGALALATLCAWSLSDYVNANLEALPVKRVPSLQASGVDQFDVKNLFPVWVANSARNRAEENGERSVDDLFKENAKDLPPTAAQLEAAPAPAPALPDFAALLATHMHLEGISGNGGFVNGKFYKVGEEITDFAYPNGNQQVIPKVVEVRARSIVVAHGKKRTEISL